MPSVASLRSLGSGKELEYTTMQMNRVEIAGYLSKKPEVRYLPSGTPVANARLGQSHRYQDSNQQWQEHTNWHSLSFYGDLSNVALGFEKGANIYVEGTIEQREFTPKDGSRRTINEIVVRHCHVIAPSRQATAAENGAATTTAEPVPQFGQGAADHDDDWPVR
jgi:single-strand DNA-binding protein